MAQNSKKVIVDPRKAEKRRSMLLKIGAAVVLIAIAVGIGLWAVLSNESSTGSASEVTVATDNAFRVTTAPAGSTPPAVLTVIEDFQCPACRQFEEQFGPVLEELRNNPQVAVDYMPISILDRMSTTDYSTRAANASACVAESTATDGDFSTWLQFHNMLYAQQPAEGGAGLSDDQLNNLATQSGASNVRQCIDDQQFADWVADTTQAAAATGTPTVRLNGEDVALSTPEALREAVLAATN
ncbi:thioredoxin domain-containing protein [Gordonia sp. HNM0687]|uniref:Thioredoxin domain-containing protein n=1 Tax=Gordonia mangrovi TaxID=2665643 RepID=A0A6L7GKP9_9ACTN|nr:thioredoxin domain-containing protein [Gordonia mangrovi]MXP20470.1 thioredoxin domain-containing protein [Gordonia mangrovi]UVF78934.1 thioredoxin domain-containing protein [Gordonia mangrovi]